MHAHVGMHGRHRAIDWTHGQWRLRVMQQRGCTAQVAVPRVQTAAIAAPHARRGERRKRAETQQTRRLLRARDKVVALALVGPAVGRHAPLPVARRVQRPSCDGAATAGAHVAALLAYNASGVSAPSDPLPFTIPAQTDPCTPPLGAHAPAIFPTSPQFTGSKGPGSRAFLNYQLGGPDRVTEVAIQVDGADSSVGRATGPTDDLKAFSGMWFTQPSVGSHTLGVRVLTSFGCSLVRQTSLPLVVK